MHNTLAPSFSLLPAVTQETYNRYTDDRAFMSRASASVRLALQWTCFEERYNEEEGIREELEAAYQKLVELQYWTTLEANELYLVNEFDLQELQEVGFGDENTIHLSDFLQRGAGLGRVEPTLFFLSFWLLLFVPT